MQAVGRVVAETLAYLAAEARAGLATGQLDDLGARFLERRGARSAPQRTYGFPGCTCISVNDEVVHGVPGPRRLVAGDLVKIDVTAELDGFIADAARTVALPGAPSRGRRLMRCARRALRAALAVARAGAPLRMIGRTIEGEVRRAGFAVLRELTGHGVGRGIHEPPSVPNFDDPEEGRVLHEGLVLAVEPLIAERPAQVVEGPDRWTLRTDNGALAAHQEHTIVVRRGGPLVLTAP